MTDESTIHTGLFSLAIPDGWSTEEFEGADAVLVAPVAAGDFRANVAVDAAWRQHPGAQVVAADVCPGDVEGRRLTFTYPDAVHTVVLDALLSS